MSAPPLLNAAGRRRSPVTLPGHLAGRPPRNKGLRYPPDPPTVEEIVAVMRQAGDHAHGARLRALIVLLWRAGLRINEALTVTEHDLDARLGAILVRHGKGGRRREVGMDPWGWDHLRPWVELRMAMPVGPLLCVIEGPTRGRPWAATPPELSCGESPLGPGREGASRRTSCATPTPSSSPTRASRSTSSSGSWGIPTSASRPSICRASTTPRSSPPSTPETCRCSPPGPDSEPKPAHADVAVGRAGTAHVDEQHSESALLLLVQSSQLLHRWGVIALRRDHSRAAVNRQQSRAAPCVGATGAPPC
jgi:hypothetical protein